MELFFKAVAQQSADRASGSIPDLESYVHMRRDTSGCKPCFALIEYAAGIDLPDQIIDHPAIRALEEATNDLVTWSNVCFLSTRHYLDLHVSLSFARTFSHTASSGREMTRTT